MSTYRYQPTRIEDITPPSSICDDEKRFYLEAQIIEEHQVTPWDIRIVITCSRTRLAEWGIARQEEYKLFYFCGTKFLEAKIAAGEIEKKRINQLDLDLDKEYGEDAPCDPNKVVMEQDWSVPIEVKRRIGF